MYRYFKVNVSLEHQRLVSLGSLNGFIKKEHVPYHILEKTCIETLRLDSVKSSKWWCFVYLLSDLEISASLLR